MKEVVRSTLPNKEAKEYLTAYIASLEYRLKERQAEHERASQPIQKKFLFWTYTVQPKTNEDLYWIDTYVINECLDEARKRLNLLTSMPQSTLEVEV